MRTVEIMYKPGDVVKYRSSRYGIAVMEVVSVKLIWNKYDFTIKYLGYPKYLDPPRKRYYSCKVGISDLKNIELVKES